MFLVFIFTLVSTFAAEITQKLSDIWFNDIFFARMYFVMIIYILIDVAVENIHLFQDNKHLARALALAMALLIQYMIPDSLFQSVMRSGLAGFGALLLITLLVAILLLRSFGMQDSPIAKYLLIALLVLMILILVLLFFPHVFGLSRGFGLPKTSASATWVFLILTIVYIFALLFVAAYADKVTPLVASLIVLFLFLSYLQLKNAIFGGYNLDSFSNFLYWTAIAVTLIVWFYIWRNFVPKFDGLRNNSLKSTKDPIEKEEKKRRRKELLKKIFEAIGGGLLLCGYSLTYVFNFLRKLNNFFRSGAYVRLSNSPIVKIIQKYTDYLSPNIELEILNQVSCINRERIRFRVRRSRLNLFQSFIVLLWDESPNDREMYFYAFDKNTHIDAARTNAQYVYYEVPFDKLVDYKHGSRTFIAANFNRYQYCVIASNDASGNLINIYQQLVVANHNYRVATNLFFYNIWNGYISSLNAVTNVGNINATNVPKYSFFTSFYSFLAEWQYRATGKLPPLPLVYRSYIRTLEYNPNLREFRITDPHHNADVTPVVSFTLDSPHENLDDFGIFVMFLPRQHTNPAYLLYCGNSTVNPNNIYYINPTNRHQGYLYPFSYSRTIGTTRAILADGDYTVSIIGIRLCGNTTFKTDLTNFINNNIINNAKFQPISSNIVYDNVLMKFEVDPKQSVTQRVGQAFREIVNHLNANHYRYFTTNPITIHVHSRIHLRAHIAAHLAQIQNILNRRRNEMNDLLNDFQNHHQAFFNHNPHVRTQLQNIINDYFNELENFLTTNPNATFIQFLMLINHRRNHAILQLMGIRAVGLGSLLADFFIAAFIQVSQEITSDVLALP